MKGLKAFLLTHKWLIVKCTLSLVAVVLGSYLFFALMRFMGIW